MAHSCLSHWGNAAEELTKLLDDRTTPERQAALERYKALPKDVRKDLAKNSPNRRTYHGWIHRVDGKVHYARLTRLYLDLCLALKQPTDLPNHRGATPPDAKLPPVDSKALGKLALAVIQGLEADGTETAPGAKLPFHSEDGFPRYGMGNWLEKPPELHKKTKERPMPVARALLRALRAAMDR